jgi:glycosyltransferase EpsF
MYDADISGSVAMTPMRVLHVIGRMDRAGAETLVMNLYREMDRGRCQFDFVYFSTERCDYDDEIEALGGQIFRVPGGQAARFTALWRLMRRGEWSIVHAHTLFSSGLHLLTARMAGVRRRVAHSHNTSDANSRSRAGRAYQALMRWLLSWVPTDYVACGGAASDYLFPGRHDVLVIPNAVDIRRFMEARPAQLSSADATPDSLVIVQVGRLMPVKNQAMSVRVAAALRDMGVEFQMLFVGAGPDQAAIEALIGQHRLEGQVHLLGMREDIPEVMAAADVMVMPSLHEGFPVVLVEAQAAGLPAVISSAISGEVDLGLGLVRFVDLNASPKDWAARILQAARVEVAPDVRLQVLADNGFSARAGAERLLSVYQAI